MCTTKNTLRQCVPRQVLRQCVPRQVLRQCVPRQVLRKCVPRQVLNLNLTVDNQWHETITFSVVFEYLYRVVARFKKRPLSAFFTASWNECLLTNPRCISSVYLQFLEVGRPFTKTRTYPRRKSSHLARSGLTTNHLTITRSRGPH